MGAVSERDAAALLDVAAELVRLDDPRPFPPRLLGLLAGLLGRRHAAYSELDRRNERSVAYSEWADGEEYAEVGDSGASRPYWRLRHSHPLCARREGTLLDWTTPHAVSDFATRREFRATAIWNELYRPAGIECWMDMGLRPRHGHTRVFLSVDEQRDFDEREKTLLALLAPHLERRAAEAETAAAAADALTRVEEAATDGVHAVVLVSAKGTIEFASAESRATLSRHFGTVKGRLPAALATADGVVVRTHGEARLTVHVARVGSLRVLLLAEDDTRIDRLTPRQREILRHVAAGLTDVQIAERLEIAPATVGKHLEAIYARLDAHTRTAAAALLR